MTRPVTIIYYLYILFININKLIYLFSRISPSSLFKQKILNNFYNIIQAIQLKIFLILLPRNTKVRRIINIQI